MLIRQIIDKINERQLFVPAFQREYVWKREHVKKLFDSLIKSYPTGTMLSWETNNPPELKGDTQYRPEMGAIKLILDGQQRITTIYLIMTGNIPPYYTKNDITSDVLKLYVNLDTLALEYYSTSRMGNNPLWRDLTDIFTNKIRASDVLRDLEKNGEVPRELFYRIEDNFNRIRTIENKDFIEQTIPITADIKEAIDIFYIVNDSGVNLTEAELALAQICGYWPDARKLFKKKLQILAENGFVFKLDFIIYALLGMLYSLGSDMTKLHGSENAENVKAAWQRLDNKILDYTINLLRSHAYIDHYLEINTIYALIPIICFINKKQDCKLNQEEIQKAIKWFYYAQLRTRYVSQLPQKLDKDLGIITNKENPFDEMIGNIEMESRLKITAAEFIGKETRHPLFNLMKCYFKSKGAVCLGTGVKLHQNMGKKYALEKDHIFAYSRLKEQGYGMDNRFKYALAQEITNRAILTSTENGDKSDEDTATYLQTVKKRFPDALKLQEIPENEELWKIENFEQFLDKRREMLAVALNSFIENITKTELTISPVSVEDMISEGENSNVELKSSLRWDTKENKLNKELCEGIIIKTIAAFSNGFGGTLLIGVSDEGEVLGLQPDYATIKFSPDKDGFEQHLRNVVESAYGMQLAVSLKVSFPLVQEKEICMVEVSMGNKPIYTSSKDKNGQQSEKFYIRSGNASKEIEKPSEIAEYCETRFGKKMAG